jgi:lipopolysaccharide export LptBFGC system permease protein LptF
VRKIIQFLCGFAVLAAIFFSWLWTLSFVNRVNIYRNREAYKPATFLVSGAEYYRGDEGGDSWWLTGTVTSHDERLVPRLRGAPLPRSAGDLTARYPKGTKIEVLYNPDATETLVQGESLRVLSATPDFWQEEARLRYRLALRVLVPVPLTLAVYLAVRYVNRRHARLHSQPNAG